MNTKKKNFYPKLSKKCQKDKNSALKFEVLYMNIAIVKNI